MFDVLLLDVARLNRFLESSHESFAFRIGLRVEWRDFSVVESQLFRELGKLCTVKWRSVIGFHDTRNAQSGEDLIHPWNNDLCRCRIDDDDLGKTTEFARISSQTNRILLEMVRSSRSIFLAMAHSEVLSFVEVPAILAKFEPLLGKECSFSADFLPCG